MNVFFIYVVRVWLFAASLILISKKKKYIYIYMLEKDRLNKWEEKKFHLHIKQFRDELCEPAVCYNLKICSECS